MSRKVLLLSNSRNHGGKYLEHASDIIRELFAGVQTVVFIPYALKDKNDYTEHVKAKLSELGFAVKGVHEGNPVENIREAEAIYIGGGNTFRLLKCLYEESLLPEIRKRVLQDNVPYMGSSAGSNVATPSIHTTNDMAIVYPQSLEALSLVPFNINPHYIDHDPDRKHMGETREARIKEFHEENTTPVLGIREGSYLYVNGTKMTLLGPTGAKLFIQGEEEARELLSGADVSFLLN